MMRLSFDRGTVVIEDPPPEVNVASLPGVLWDPRVRRYRAPASDYGSIVVALGERGVRYSDRVPDSVRPTGTWKELALPLRSYQEAAIDSWELAGRRGVVVLPTGAGKTRVALAVMAKLGSPTLCLVPTRVLLEQWGRALKECYAGPIGCFGNGVRQLAPITVSTFASAERHMARIGNRFETLIVDEAHHASGGTYRDVLAMCPATIRLGLTATPPPEGPRPGGLAEVLGPVVYELAVGDLSGTFLAPFDLITLRVELTSREEREYQSDWTVFRDAFSRFRRASPDASWTDFVRAASRSDAGRRAVAAWRRAKKRLSFTEGKRVTVRRLLQRHTESRVLIFTADNEATYKIAREFLVMPITCDIGRSERDEALARFSRGELRALVSSRVLNEGLDVPDADVAIVVGASQGAREHVQRVGRLLRPSPGKRAVVYELVSLGTTEVRQAAKRRASLVGRRAAIQS